MKKRETATQQDNPSESEMDDRLRPLLIADGELFSALLQELIEKQADPLIRKIISAKLHVSSAEHHDHFDSDAVGDLCQEAITNLVAYLRRSRQNPTDYSIKSLDEFVATIAFNAYNKYLRGKYPQRHRLKRQLYYLLRNREQLALWKESYDWISGLLQWKKIRLAQRYSRELEELSENEWTFVRSKLNGQSLPLVPLDQLLVGLFEWINHPLEFDFLVDTVSGLLKIKDHPVQSSFRERGDGEEGKISTIPKSLVVEPSDLMRVNHQEVLKRLWMEIRELPVRQRWALLCNLRDEHGDGLINTLPSCGIASPKEIADALEITLKELCALWDRFPLKDGEMGERFGISSQQVINLRKSARERLARRLSRIGV